MREGILQIVAVVSNEKNIERDAVFSALEEAIAIATRKKLRYTRDDHIEVIMDKNTGNYKTYLLEPLNIQDMLPEDLSKDELTIHDLREDQIVRTELENVDFDRICVQTAKQIIYQKIREAEGKQMYQSMRAKIGTFVKGTVKYAKNGGFVVQDFSNIHYFLPNTELINNESFKINERVQAILHDVVIERNRNRFILSRRSDAFLEQLLYLEVPEISEGSIQIKGIARNPGVRAKVLVKSNDRRIDCVGACIGIRGMRAQMITNALDGERLGIIEWDESVAQLVVNILAPIGIESIAIDESERRVHVAVSEEMYAQAIGKEGQNVQMVSKLLGWQVNIFTPRELAEKKLEANKDKIADLATQLQTSVEIAAGFVEAGYSSFEDVAYIEDAEVIARLAKNIEGVDSIILKAQETLLVRTLQGYNSD